MPSFFNAATQTSLWDCHFLETQTYTEIDQSKLFIGSGSNVYLQPEGNLHALMQNTNFGVLHDSSERFPTPRCHPGTRKTVLEEIRSWADQPSHLRKQPCFWLCGSVGSGKTAVAQTIAEEWNSQNRLGASCFVTPPFYACKNRSAIIPAIAYQLAIQFPPVLPHFKRAIQDDPLIFQKSISCQMTRLIFDPFRQARTKNYTNRDEPKVVVIDGLEQYGDAHFESECITLLLRAIFSGDLPIILLFTSRNEPRIEEAMTIHTPHSVHHFVLDNAADTSADIEAYIRSRLHRIKGSLQCFTSSEDVVQKLNKKSSGQFLHAAVITDYLSSPGGHTERRLDAILGQRFNGFDGSFEELDRRYHQILTPIDQTRRSIVMDVLAWLVFKGGGGEVHELKVALGGNHIGSALSPAVLEAILMLEPGMVHDSLINLHSILRIPQTSYEPIQVYHTSFFDFLAEKRRALSFFMDKRTASRHIAKCLLKHLGIPKTFEGWASLSYNQEDNNRAQPYLGSSSPTDRSKRGSVWNRVKRSCNVLSKGTAAFERSELLDARQNGTPLAISTFLEDCVDGLDIDLVQRHFLRHRLKLYRIWKLFGNWFSGKKMSPGGQQSFVAEKSGLPETKRVILGGHAFSILLASSQTHWHSINLEFVLQRMIHHFTFA